MKRKIWVSLLGVIIALAVVVLGTTSLAKDGPIQTPFAVPTQTLSLEAIGPIYLDCPQGMPNSVVDTLEWVATEDILIIGVQVEANMDFNSAGPSANGDAYCMGIASLSPTNSSCIDGCFAKAYAKIRHTPVGLQGELIKTLTVMFPSGYGIELDAGEKLYLHAWAMNRMDAGCGPMMMSVQCYVYYVPN